MSEPEKWEKYKWYLFPYDTKIRLAFGNYKNKSLVHDKIILTDDELSIGNFSFKLANIVRFQDEGSYSIAIYCIDGNNYKLFPGGGGAGRWKSIISNGLLAFSEKLKQYEKIKMSNAIKFVKNLPTLYNEINLDDISLRTGFKRGELMEIIENLISNEELKAEIRGNMLKLKKEPEAVASPPGYTSETSPVQGSEKREGMSVFVSYATKDAELYKIPELARKLEEYKEIGEVLYWQEDMHDSIIEYMNDNLGRCNGVLLFCSPNALNSIPVKKEWMAAEALKKPIIPIFLKPEHIPPLLSDRLGLEFDNFDLQKNVREIHDLFLKKTQS